MRIEPNEIAEIQEAGELDGAPVKMVRTKGGFWIATGRPMGRPQDQALSAGSHPAIVRYNVEKMFPNFRPAMMKSITFTEESLVQQHSQFLSEELRKSGHDIYSVQTGNRVDFLVTVQNMTVASVGALLKNENLEVSDLDFTSDFVKGLAGAVAEKAMLLNAGFRLV
jgi:hypothetical protein